MARRKINISVGRAGQATETISINDGATVADILGAAGLNMKETEQVSINGEIFDVTDTVENGDTVLLVQGVGGGI